MRGPYLMVDRWRHFQSISISRTLGKEIPVRFACKDCSAKTSSSCHHLLTVISRPRHAAALRSCPITPWPSPPRREFPGFFARFAPSNRQKCFRWLPTTCAYGYWAGSATTTLLEGEFFAASGDATDAAGALHSRKRILRAPSTGAADEVSAKNQLLVGRGEGGSLLVNHDEKRRPIATVRKNAQILWPAARSSIRYHASTIGHPDGS